MVSVLLQIDANGKNRFAAVSPPPLLALFPPPNSSVSASLSTLDKPVCRLAMPAGSSTVWSTVSSQTARCHLTRLSEAETTPPTLSSARRAPGSTYPVPFLSTWSPLLSVSRSVLYSNTTYYHLHEHVHVLILLQTKCVLVPTASSSIPNS